MTVFTVGASILVAASSLAAAGWCARDVGRRAASPGARAAWWSALALGLAAIPLLAGPGIPVRVERTLYEGPDLLSPEPEVTRVAGERWAVPGLVRERTLRTTQGERLLREARRVEVAVPVLLLLVLGAWAAVRTPRRPALLLVLSLGGALSAGCAPGDGQEASLAEVRLLELMAMRQSGDVAGIEALFNPVAVWDDYPNQLQHRGLPEITDFVLSLHGWASGVFLDVVRTHAAGDRAVAEWVLQGVHSAPWPGVADSATFRRFTLEGVTVVELERGLIVRAADYADMVPLILDLGGSVTLPGGEVVARPEPEGAPGG